MASSARAGVPSRWPSLSARVARGHRVTPSTRLSLFTPALQSLHLPRIVVHVMNTRKRSSAAPRRQSELQRRAGRVPNEVGGRLPAVRRRKRIVPATCRRCDLVCRRCCRDCMVHSTSEATECRLLAVGTLTAVRMSMVFGWCHSRFGYHRRWIVFLPGDLDSEEELSPGAS